MKLVSNHPSDKVFPFLRQLRHLGATTLAAINTSAIYSFPTFCFSRGYSPQQSPMILRVSELQTGWVFVTPITIGPCRNFEVIENWQYMSKSKFVIVVDFVLPISPRSASPLPARIYS